MMLRHMISVVCCVLLGWSLTSVTVRAAESGAAKPARVMSALVKRAAIVESIDRETRELKLIDAQGNRFTVTVDDRVRNFDQIEPRDRIVAEYLESVAVVVSAAGTKPTVGDADVLTVAAAGDKPGVERVQTEMVTATIEALNVDDRMVTLKTADGSVRTIKVGPDAPLDKVEVGDQLHLKITRAIAINVVRPDDQ